MAWVVADRVRETIVFSNGNGDFVMEGNAPNGFRTLGSVLLNESDNFFYAIIGVTVPTEWEIGVASWSLSFGGKFTRVIILASSNAGAIVNFSAGTKDVFLTAAAMVGQTGVAQNKPPGNTVVPPDCTMYVYGSFEIAAGKRLELMAGAVLVIDGGGSI